MTSSTQDRSLRGLFRQPLVRFPARLRTFLQAGIGSPDRMVRRRQMFTNMVAYIAAFNAAIHFATNAAYDFAGLAPVNAYNAAMFVFCLLNHRLHRYGSLTAAIVLIIGIAIGHSFVVFALGTASDLHFYFTLAGFTLFLVGVDNIRIFLALYAVGFAALVISFAFAPENGFVMASDADLRRSLSLEAAVNAIVMNGALITIVLVSLHRAEQRSERLLAAMLPSRIVERLRDSPDRRIADRVDGCSILFVDFVGFTTAVRQLEPERVVAYLDGVFSAFDAACERLGADKIKTIGDSYMAVGGLDGRSQDGARAIGELALQCLAVAAAAPSLGDHDLALRIGIHSGPVTAGVIGDSRVAYDVWGDAVNIASRMESHGVPGRIHVSAAFKALGARQFSFEPRGSVDVKSLGAVQTFFLTGPAPAA